MSELILALGTSRRPQAAKAESSEPSSRSASAAKPDIAVLRTRLQALVQALDPDDPADLRKARRGLVQEILLWEFGPEFRQDAEFAAMIDSVERALDTDPRSGERLQGLVRSLLS